MKWIRSYGSRALVVIAVLCLIFTASFTGVSVRASTEPNLGFEQDFEGWTTYDNVAIGTGADYPTNGYVWTVLPYETQMAVLTPTGPNYAFEAAADALELSPVSRGYITGIFPNITNVAYIYTDLDLETDEDLTMSWNYVATDYSPFNDASFCSLVNLDNPSYVPVVNGCLSQVGILGATVLGTGNYSTGNYGSTGWQTASFQAPVAGHYRLGFVVFNLSDMILSPYLFVDKEPGSTLQDGIPFAPIPPESDPPVPPSDFTAVVTTVSTGSVTADSAEITGEVVTDFGQAVTERGIAYGTSPDPTVDDGKAVSGSGLGTFTATLSGLSGGTTYYARAFATNACGTSYGETLSFTTIPAAPAAMEASLITKDGFQARWNTAAGASGYRLDVACDMDFTVFVPGYENLDVGSATDAVIGGLDAATTYYYRVRAYNDAGVSGSSDKVGVCTSKNDQTIDFPALPAKTYGDEPFSPGASASSDLEITYESSDPDVAEIVDGQICIVGKGSALITAKQSGNDLYNAAEDVSQMLAIDVKVLTVGGTIAAEDKPYDGTADAVLSGGELIGVVPGDTVVLENASSGIFSQSDAGSDLPVVTAMTISGASSPNYALQQPELYADILPRPIEVTAENRSKIYGGTDPDLAYDITDGTLIGDDAFTGSISRASGESAGDYAIGAGTLALDGNYALTFIEGTFTVEPRPVTVTAEDKTKAYGAADPELTYTLTDGSLLGDDAFTGSLVRAAGESAGEHAIGQGSLTLGADYTLTVTEGTLTVEPYLRTLEHGVMRNGDDPDNTGRISFVAVPDEGYIFAYWYDGSGLIGTEAEIVGPGISPDSFDPVFWAATASTDREDTALDPGQPVGLGFLDGEFSVTVPGSDDPAAVFAVTRLAEGDFGGGAILPDDMNSLSLFYSLLQSENLDGQEVRIRISLSGAAAETDPALLRLYVWNGETGQWEDAGVRSQGFDAETGEYWADILGGGTLGLFYANEAQIPVTGDRSSALWIAVSLLSAMLLLAVFAAFRAFGRKKNGFTEA